MPVYPVSQNVDPLRALRCATVLATIAALIIGLLSLASPARATRTPAPKVAPVPQGFVGMDVNDPMLVPNGPINTVNQLTSMVRNGVQTVRVAFNWAALQPYPNLSDVPADQHAQFTAVPEPVPTDFSATDELVGDAARKGLTILPTILYAPYWDARSNGTEVATPLRVGPYATFAAELVKRYGPRGSYWGSHPNIPKLPIRMWQIWNEPNLSYYWHQPFAKGYVQLLRAAHTAIKDADPSAKVVLGAVTNLAWKALGQIYATGGNIRSQFDIAAVNSFTKTPADVVTYLRLVHRALTHDKDAKKPLMATEFSWPSAVGQTNAYNDFNVSPSGQARNLGTLLPLLGAQRKQLNLISVYYYTWIGLEYRNAPAFNFAGLFRLRKSSNSIEAKPALAVFRRGVLRLEGCRAKGSTATRCLH